MEGSEREPLVGNNAPLSGVQVRKSILDKGFTRMSEREGPLLITIELEDRFLRDQPCLPQSLLLNAAIATPECMIG